MFVLPQSVFYYEGLERCIYIYVHIYKINVRLCDGMPIIEILFTI